MNCKKKRYESRQNALHAIKLIQRTSKRNKVPQRTYQCYKCEGWHLTSMDAKSFNELVEYHRKAREVRIQREAEYWENKFGINDDF